MAFLRETVQGIRGALARQVDRAGRVLAPAPRAAAEAVRGAEPGPLYGFYPAIVTDAGDPEGRARVRVEVRPAAGTRPVAAWAPIATLAASDGAGTWWAPSTGDHVLVAFEAGDVSRPYVIGALWGAGQAPPGSVAPGGPNHERLLRTPAGVEVRLLDGPGQAAFEVRTPQGQRITLHDGTGSVELADSNGNRVRMEPAGMTVTASAKVTVDASVVEVSAGSVSVAAGMSTFSGTVQCDTLIANSVVGSSYTPGAGNVW